MIEASIIGCGDLGRKPASQEVSPVAVTTSTLRPARLIEGEVNN